jgi:hypothetical protein
MSLEMHFSAMLEGDESSGTKCGVENVRHGGALPSIENLIP